MAVVEAWHFVASTLRDGSAIPLDGEWLVHDGPVAIRESGLHASERIVDALRHAPGDTLCRVECDDVVERHDDKFVCVRRRILWRLYAGPVLQAWARWCALQVIDQWDAPDVVRRFLETGDEALRDEARRATDGPGVFDAREAACEAASSDYGVACHAVWDAAKSAADALGEPEAWDRFEVHLAVMVMEAREADRL